MIELIERRRAEVGALCRRYHVRRLDLFGSAARETDFNETSDVDLMVEFEAAHSPPAFGDFLALRQALGDLFGRDVDLTMAGAVVNPFIRASIERSRRSLHGA